VDKLRDLILERVTLIRGKIHCGLVVITDQLAQVVTDVNGEPSGVESIEMYIPLTSKYRSRPSAVSYVAYTAIFWFASLFDIDIRS